MRHGFNAAVAAFQMVDLYFNFHKRHDPEKIAAYSNKGVYLEHLYRTCKKFKDIRSIANAYKHLYVRGRNVTVASTGAIEQVDFISKDIREMYSDYRGDDDFVVYEKRTGERIRLLESLKDTISMWKKELYI